jgi:vacuolar-type H+-ATPase subunit I/STV1
LESIVELIDVTFALWPIPFFYRIAAFALSHAALFAAVFSIGMLSLMKRERNLLLLVVMREMSSYSSGRTGRLHSDRAPRVLRFSAKFYRGGGEPFKPFDQEIGSQGKPL